MKCPKFIILLIHKIKKNVFLSSSCQLPFLLWKMLEFLMVCSSSYIDIVLLKKTDELVPVAFLFYYDKHNFIIIKKFYVNQK